MLGNVICSLYERQYKTKLSIMEGAFYGISAKGKFGKKSMRDAAAEAGVSQETFRRWIVQYEADGAAARVSA